MIEAAIKSILIRKYRGYKVYFHNFSKFDALFILPVLVDMKDIKVSVLKREDRILKIHIQYVSKNIKKSSDSKDKYSLTIYDSYLILPAGLDKLAKAFNCESKGMFPLKFLNIPNISLDYIGKVPEMKYFYHPNPLTHAAEYRKFVVNCNDYRSKFNNIK
jgi:hypothetical protein